MPRLKKEKIDKIKEMIRQGYIDVEICAKTSVSRPTVRKIRRGMESEKSVEAETFLKNGETSIFLDLQGKKIRFTDVVAEFLVKSGLFPLKKSTLKSVLFEMFSPEINELKECFLATMSARLIEEFRCVDCGSEKSVVPVRCATCGHAYLWGSEPEYTQAKNIEK